MSQSRILNTLCEESSTKSRCSQKPLLQVDAIYSSKQILSIARKYTENYATSLSVLSRIKNNIKQLYGLYKETNEPILATHEVGDVAVIFSKGIGKFKGCYKLQAFIGDRAASVSGLGLLTSYISFGTVGQREEYVESMNESTEQLIKYFKRNNVGAGLTIENRIGELLEKELIASRNNTGLCKP